MFMSVFTTTPLIILSVLGSLGTSSSIPGAVLTNLPTGNTSEPIETDATPGEAEGSPSGEALRLTEELRREVQEGLGQLREGLGQLRDELRSKAAVTGSNQNPLYRPPNHFHYYYHHPQRPTQYDPDNTAAAEELSALRELLQATESRLRATEYRLRATETKLQTFEGRLRAEPDEPQATQSRPRSCEDKLIATQERLESAERKFIQLESTVNSAQTQALTANGTLTHGSTFVRWGRTQCPNNTELVYTGLAGGAWHAHQGAAANRLCLTMEPEFDNTAPTPNLNYIYGVEYEEIPGHHNHDAPCCVCRAPQSTTIMVPATLTCPPGWVTQYSGHLMAGFHNHPAASEFLCLDGEPEHRLSGEVSKDGALLYYTVTQCGSLPCPPYVNAKVVTCVVCSK